MSEERRIIPFPKPRPRLVADRGAAPCPVCGKPEAVANRPFCSSRCAEIDLGRWLKGIYRIPTPERPDEGEATGAPEESER